MRRLVMAQRLSASIAPSPTDRYAAPPELPAPAPPTTPCGGHLLAASTPPRATQLPPLPPTLAAQAAALGVDADDYSAAVGLTLRGLKARARELGVSDAVVEEIDDAEDSKVAALELVMRATTEKGEVGVLVNRHHEQAKRRLKLASKATLGGVKQGHMGHVFDHLKKPAKAEGSVGADGGKVIRGYDTNGDGIIDALDTVSTEPQSPPQLAFTARL